jgi:hypothetical protein
MLRFLLASIDLLMFGMEEFGRSARRRCPTTVFRLCSMALQGCDVQDKSITNQ